MTRRYVKQLANGEAVDEVFLVAEKQLRSNRQGQLYLQLDLRDRSGTIGARLWNASEEQSRTFDTGDYVQARGKVQLFQGAAQLILTHVEPTSADLVDPGEFLPQATRGVAEMTARLRQIADGRLRTLTAGPGRVLPDRRRLPPALRHGAGRGPDPPRLPGGPARTRPDPAWRSPTGSPASIRTSTATCCCSASSCTTPARSSSSITTGPSATPTRGSSIGHIVLGVELLNEKVRRTADLTGEPFPAELLLRLKHMIVSHHGPAEFGSPKPPMTPEAIALHYLDNLDAKVHAYLPADPRGPGGRLVLDRLRPQPRPSAVQGQPRRPTMASGRPGTGRR